MTTVNILTAEALDARLSPVMAALDDIRSQLDRAKVEPAPEWIPAKDYAARVGKHVATVKRWAKAGTITSRMEGNVLMVRIDGGTT